MVTQSTLDQLFTIKAEVQALRTLANKLPKVCRLPDVDTKLRLLERFLEEQIHVVGRQVQFMEGANDESE